MRSKIIFSIAILFAFCIYNTNAADNRCGSQGGGATCAQLGFPGYCCSSEGWCGTDSGYCGTGCQNGCPGTVTSAPVTSAPVTSAPVTSAPVTSAPTTTGTSTGSCAGVPNGINKCHPTDSNAFMSCPSTTPRTCGTNLVCQNRPDGTGVDCVWGTPSTSGTTPTPTTPSPTTPSPTTPSPTTPSPTTTPTVSPSSGLPRKVIYISWKTTDVSTAITQAVNAGYTHIIISFWVNNAGGFRQSPADAAAVWTGYSESTKRDLLNYAHAAGAVIMGSGGGGTDNYLHNGDDVAYVSTLLANWAKNNLLDGVDLDLEGIIANPGPSEAQSIIAAVNAVRAVLGPKVGPNIETRGKIVSSAPQGPHFAAYYGKVWQTVLQAVGDKLDFISIQYYNQYPAGCYDDYSHIFVQSGTANANGEACHAESSVLEISGLNNYPLNNIVLGKYIVDGGNNFNTPQQIRSFVVQAQQNLGWNAGVMLWEWLPVEAPQWIDVIYP